MSTQRIALSCVLSATMFVLTGCPLVPKGAVGSIKHQGLTRTYVLHVPPTYTDTEPVPLLLALHGAPLSGRDMQRRSGFDAVADREGFIVCYPDGRNGIWNSNPSQAVAKNLPDDIGFLNALVDALCRDYAIDESRIYVAGMSNGGLMAYRLAGAMGDRLAGVASVIATFPIGFDAYCVPPRPIPMVMILGTEDIIFPWEGGFDTFGNACYQPVEETVGYWVEMNGARFEPVVEELPDTDETDGTRVLRETFRAKRGGEPVVLYAIEGGGHTWPGAPSIPVESWAGVGNTCRDFDGAEAIWAFFRTRKLR